MKGAMMRDLTDFIIDFQDYEVDHTVGTIIDILANESVTRNHEELLERAKFLQDSGSYGGGMNYGGTKRDLYKDLQNAEFYYYSKLMIDNLKTIIKAYCEKHNKKMPDDIYTFDYLEDLEDNE